MALTNAQLLLIKAEIQADAALMAIWNAADGRPASDKAFDIAVALNQVAVPDYIVWRGEMPVADIEQNGFAWASLDAVPAAKYRIWERLTASGRINPSKANVRAGISDFAKDSIGNTIVALRDSILPHLKRKATRAEKALVNTGAGGNGTDATPSTMGFEGALVYQDVLNAMAAV